MNRCGYLPVRVTVVLLALLLWSVFAVPVYGAISEAERNALIALYNSTNGAGWTNNTNWLGAAGSENTWFGVVTDAGNTRVLQLQLANNRLIGPLPAEIGDFPYLQTLLLGQNSLTGSIPADIFDLTSLTTINLINNQLTGSVPAGLSRLTQLTYLSFAANQLTGSIPAELGSLTNLQFLYLNSNQFSGSIPAELGNLTALRRLYLDANSLTGTIPAALGNLTQLQFLRLGFCSLSGSVPSELGNLTALTTLYLGQNYLSGTLPATLGNLVNLTALYLQGNAFTGAVPDSLANLTLLTNGVSDFRWNGLYTENAALRAFLNTKQTGGNWESTQTIAPVNVRVTGIDYTTAQLAWDIVSYRSDPGSYRVFYATASGGPYVFYAATANKNTVAMNIAGLQEGVDYYFAVRTRTDAHLSNKGAVDSNYSAEATARTLSDVISGYIRLSGGQGVSGAAVVFSNGGGAAATDSGGFYSRVLPHGWSGTATPSLAGYTFTPTTRNYTNIGEDYPNENYTAATVLVSISGRVTAGGGGLGGVSLQVGGVGSVLTDATGNYVAQVPYNWSGVVTPVLAGYAFTPGSRSYVSLTAESAGQDYSAVLNTHTIRGQVRTGGGAPLAGATVTFSNGGGAATADGAGNYSLTVSYGWSGSATPSLAGYTFTPAVREYAAVTGDQTGQDFIGQRISLTISGRVRSVSHIPIAGVAVTFSNGGGTAYSDSEGEYSLTVSYGWSGVATPSSAGWTFDPASRNYVGVTASVSGDNYTGTAITPAISGRIADSGGAGVSHVQVVFSGAGSATTDDSGNYTQILPYGWSGTATPVLAGYTFTPVSRQYNTLTGNQPGQDYTAQAVRPVISGRVTMGGSGASGTTVVFSNNGGSVITDQNGAYAMAVVYGWSGTVTPSREGLTFTPAVRTLSNVMADAPSQDFAAQAVTPVISGRATVGGAPAVGVTITFSNNGGVVVTDQNGEYAQALAYNWSGVVTPSRTGFTFTPASRAYTALGADTPNQDFTAQAITPVISGRIVNAAGTGLSGVTLSFSNSGGQTVSDNNGNYTQAVTYGWSGTVTPNRPGYTFSPTGRNYTNVTVNDTGGNYLATAITPVISGRVSAVGGAGLSGVQIRFSNGGGETLTDNNGNYAQTVAFGWSGVATPYRTGYSFTPENRSYSNVSGDSGAQDYVARTLTVLISGRVTDSAGGGVAGVMLSFGTSGGVAYSDASGYYRHTLANGWSGILTPSRAGYLFSPVSRTFTEVVGDLSGQDFIAAFMTATISGRVMDHQGEALVGVTLSFSNNGGEAVSDVNGFYSRTLAYGWGGTVTPSKAGQTFIPPRRDYSSLIGDITGQDYAAAPVTPLIAGLITTAAGTGVPGVTLSFSNNGGVAVTDASGAYAQKMPHDWSGTVVPSKPGYTFTPVQRSYQQLASDRFSENYTAATTLPVISGRIANAAGKGIFGAVIVFSNGGGVTSSDANGNYSHNVPSGWSGEARPSAPGFVFSPEFIVYNLIVTDQGGQNYSAVAVSPGISGRVTDLNGVGVFNVTLVFSGDGGATGTDTEGYYLHPVAYGWSGTVTAVKTGYVFSPAERVFDEVEADQQNMDFSARAVTPLISGRVIISSGAPAPGVKITAQPGGYSVTTNEQGAYSFSVPFGWGGEIAPENPAFRFSPEKMTLSDIESDTFLADFVASRFITLQCQAVRETVTAWIIKRDIGRISIRVKNPDRLPVKDFILKKRVDGGQWTTLKSFPAQDQTEFTLTYTDKYLEKKRAYSYMAAAVDAQGNETGQSEVVII